MKTNSTIRAEGNHVCPHRFAFMLDNRIRRWIQNPARILESYIQPGDTVIDLGCGPGFLTMDMARLVGPEGRVIAVDLQPQMLARVRRKAEKLGLSDRITCHQCEADCIGLDDRADFVLAFYMVHEAPDTRSCLAQIKALMKEDAQLLVVEPRLHVSKQAFRNMIVQAESVGLIARAFPKKRGGRAVVFESK